MNDDLGCFIILFLVPLAVAAYVFFTAFGLMIVWGMVASWFNAPTLAYMQATIIESIALIFQLPLLCLTIKRD